MSKNPGRKWRRGKRRNRQEKEGLDQDANAHSTFQTHDHGGHKPNDATKSVPHADNSSSGHSKNSGTATDHDRFPATGSKIGGGESGGSSGALTNARPSELVIVTALGVQDMPFGEQSSQERKRSRRRTRRPKAGSPISSEATIQTGEGLNAPAPLTAMAQKSSHQSSHGANVSQLAWAEQSSEISGAGSKRPSKRRRNTRRKAARMQAAGENTLRNMRNPFVPVPDAAYMPTAVIHGEKRRDGKKSSNRDAVNGTRGFAQARAATQSLYAALDLGTNNCRLLIATPQERGRFRVVDGFSRIVRLGEGLAHSGRLSDGAMDRAVEALKICADKLRNHKISQHRLIATEACRQAVNGEQFLTRVKAETGMDLEIIDRETEAYLAAEGCGALMDRKADAAVLFDIGGGSSELILVDCRGGRKRISDQIVSWTSLPIGVVTLAERHGGTEVSGDVFQAMVDEVHGHLSRFEGRDALGRIWQSGQVHLLGTSGTVTTLAGIHLGLPRYERRLVDGLWLASAEIDLVIKNLLAMDYHQRASSPCIGTERADLVMAGCAILEGIRQVWPSERLRVADRGLREGMLTQLMETDSAWLPPKPGRWRKRRFSNTNQSIAQGSSDNRNGNT